MLNISVWSRREKRDVGKKDRETMVTESNSANISLFNISLLFLSFVCLVILYWKIVIV